MTDHELTTATALAMGFTILYDRSIGDTPYLDCEDRVGERVYMMWCPLKSDEQCMALVKKFGLEIHGRWIVSPPEFTKNVFEFIAEGVDLNRAIVECVAKMQSAE